MAGTSLSNIEPHEEAEAIAIVYGGFKEIAGKEPPRPAGYHVLVKTFIRPEEYKRVKGPDGKEVTLFLPDVARDDDEYQSVAALVLAVGPDAYLDSSKFPSGPWCKPGDWVVVPRYEGFKFKFRGVPLQQLPDDRIMAVIEDPMDVVPTHMADRV